jgi:hypothetical protein
VRIVVDGTEYQAVNYQTASLLHLMELKQQTRDFVPGGLGMHALEAMHRAGREHQAAVERGEDVGAPDDADLWMAVCLFLARRAAGERIGFLEAVDVRLGSIEVVMEPGDEADPADPQTPGSGGPATPEAVDVAALPV